MVPQQIVIAARNSAEIEEISKALAFSSMTSFTHARGLLERLDTQPVPLVLATSLLMDETAYGLLSRAAVLGLPYTVIYALHAAESLNILRIFGSGAIAVLGPDELSLAKSYLAPCEDCLNDMVFPPFLNDVELFMLKPPPAGSAKPLHITCLGAQALMTCSNALTHLAIPQSMSMACVGPQNAWARRRFIECLQETTLWRYEAETTITDARITLCHDFDALSQLHPEHQHVVLCHGMISEEEDAYIHAMPAETQVYTACIEGYLLKRGGEKLDTPLTANKLWEGLLSSLYAESIT